MIPFLFSLITWVLTLSVLSYSQIILARRNLSELEDWLILLAKHKPSSECKTIFPSFIFSRASFYMSWLEDLHLFLYLLILSSYYISCCTTIITKYINRIPYVSVVLMKMHSFHLFDSYSRIDISCFNSFFDI